MKYGYFDNQKNEYVITNPKTPTPWINYLGGGGYGGIISQTGGGYSFDGDPKHKRVLRYRYNSIPVDQPGRYIYIRDDTIIEQKRADIFSEITYFVPGNNSFEIWSLNIKNLAQTEKKLTLFTYAEFSFFDAVKDQQNLDWTQQIQQASFEENIIFWNAFMETWDYIFMTSNLPVSSYDTSRESFVGPYRDLSCPIVVEQGSGTNYLAKRGNGVGILSHQISLEPGQQINIIYLLGTTEDKQQCKHMIKDFLNQEQVAKEFESLKSYWEGYLANTQVTTPDQEMDIMLNTWNQYQCKTTFNWSRFVALYQLGINRGMGFRDSAQDILGVIHTIPEESKELIVKLLKCQHSDGHAYHLFYPLTGEGTCGEAGQNGGVHWYSDDHLWIILTITAYLKETGDFGFLTHKIPYVNGQLATVKEHLLAAIKFTENNMGEHNLPLAGFADWNDTINLDRGKGTAESVWTGMLYCLALKEIIGLFTFLDEKQVADIYCKYYTRQKNAINYYCWDGEWYLRAYDDDGQPLGSYRCQEGQIFLNPQSWATIAHIADGKRKKQILDNVAEYLDSDYGVVLLYPAYKQYNQAKGGITTYPPGAKENGGIFLHTNPWLIIAETMNGNNDRAYTYYRKVLPPTRNEISDLYQVEPYVYCQNILGKEHGEHGLGRNSWLTGTAAWMYQAGIYYILGIRANYNALIIDPKVPTHWSRYTVRRRFRGKWVNIECLRSEESWIEVNGQPIGKIKEVPLKYLDRQVNQVTVYFK